MLNTTRCVKTDRDISSFIIILLFCPYLSLPFCTLFCVLCVLFVFRTFTTSTETIMNAPRHPSGPAASADAPVQLDRALAIMRDMKDEYDAALAENKTFLTLRHEYHLKFEAQLRELEQVERSLVDLEAAHTKFKTEADAQIAHLKSQLSHRPSAPRHDPPDSTDDNARPNGANPHSPRPLPASLPRAIAKPLRRGSPSPSLSSPTVRVRTNACIYRRVTCESPP